MRSSCRKSRSAGGASPNDEIRERTWKFRPQLSESAINIDEFDGLSDGNKRVCCDGARTKVCCVGKKEENKTNRRPQVKRLDVMWPQPRQLPHLAATPRALTHSQACQVGRAIVASGVKASSLDLPRGRSQHPIIHHQPVILRIRSQRVELSLSQCD